MLENEEIKTLQSIVIFPLQKKKDYYYQYIIFLKYCFFIIQFNFAIVVFLILFNIFI